MNTYDVDFSNIRNISLGCVVGLLLLFHSFWIIMLIFRVKVLDKIIKTPYGSSIKSGLILWLIVSSAISIITLLIVFL